MTVGRREHPPEPVLADPALAAPALAWARAQGARVIHAASVAAHSALAAAQDVAGTSIAIHPAYLADMDHAAVAREAAALAERVVAGLATMRPRRVIHERYEPALAPDRFQAFVWLREGLTLERLLTGLAGAGQGRIVALDGGALAATGYRLQALLRAAAMRAGVDVATLEGGSAGGVGDEPPAPDGGSHERGKHLVVAFGLPEPLADVRRALRAGGPVEVWLEGATGDVERLLVAWRRSQPRLGLRIFPVAVAAASASGQNTTFDPGADPGFDVGDPIAQVVAASLRAAVWPRLDQARAAIEDLRRGGGLEALSLSEHASVTGAAALEEALRTGISVRMAAHSGWPLDRLHGWNLDHPTVTRSVWTAAAAGAADVAPPVRMRKLEWRPRRLAARMLAVLRRRPRTIGILATTGCAGAAAEVPLARFIDAIAALAKAASRAGFDLDLRLREAENDGPALVDLIRRAAGPDANVRYHRNTGRAMAVFLDDCIVVIEAGSPTSAVYEAIALARPVLGLDLPAADLGRPKRPPLPLPLLDPDDPDRALKPWLASARSRLRLVAEQRRALRGFG